MESNGISVDNYNLKLGNLNSKYRLIKEIGKGGFAVVFLAENIKTNEQVAIKIINRDEIVKNNLMNYLENELRLSLRFNHPNIVKVYDIIYEIEYILIVMEYVHNGDVLMFVRNYDTYSYERKIMIATELLSALQYLHMRGVSHRDLKPENILLDDNYHPKLIDFGLSRENSAHLHSLVGTTVYMAPEIIRCNTYDGTKADIWSFGIIMNLLVSGNFPFSDFKSDAQVVTLLSHGALDIIVEDTGIIGEAIRRALVYDPSVRPSSTELMKFFASQQIRQNSVLKPIKPRKTYESSLPVLQPRHRMPSFEYHPRIKEIGTVKTKLMYRKREIDTF